MVRSDSHAFVGALRNLVNNAVAHTPAGTSVEINLQDDGAVRVIDRGPGVPPAERELIFQRFWRGRDRSGPGAGLGLSIVKRFVEAYGFLRHGPQIGERVGVSNRLDMRGAQTGRGARMRV
jgi:signal transduction histidine kinase